MTFKERTSIKGQAIVDFVVKLTRALELEVAIEPIDLLCGDYMWTVPYEKSSEGQECSWKVLKPISSIVL